MKPPRDTRRQMIFPIVVRAHLPRQVNLANIVDAGNALRLRLHLAVRRKSNLAKTPMIAITTTNSIKVSDCFLNLSSWLAAC